VQKRVQKKPEKKKQNDKTREYEPSLGNRPINTGKTKYIKWFQMLQCCSTRVKRNISIFGISNRLDKIAKIHNAFLQIIKNL
jgi:hypothetical protein